MGEAWPDGERTEDPDPIDAPGAPVAMGGHGTHVADIVAGKTADGSHKGVAPGASLLAVKVCSAVSTSCNGVSRLRGMDFALDPNGDGDISDAADVINMSLVWTTARKKTTLPRRPRPRLDSVSSLSLRRETQPTVRTSSARLR